VAEAVGCAHRIFQPNPADFACLEPLVAAPDCLVTLKPFIDTAPFRAPDRGVSRAELSARYGLRPGEPWLLTVAMMRDDQKLSSYRLLALALADLGDLPWRLVITGAGPAESEVRAAFARHGARVRWLGMLSRNTLRQFYRSADLYVWPAVKEAYGIAPLEAQAAGLPVVAGYNEGLAGIVADGETGLLARQGDAAGFAAALRALISDAPRRARMSEAALLRTARDHDIASAAALLDRHLKQIAAAPR
jgi:glycosyltransferase involved in cell wall biosynthesis